ncbi:MAG: methyltransferase, TIGR04325 family [Gemmataceae bacterium]
MYPTFAAAAAAVPRGRNVGYDNSAATDHVRRLAGSVRPSDYAAFYWLRPLAPTLTTVFDLGGNFGHTYHHYRNYLPFRDGLVWRVCDTPAVVEASRKQADAGRPVRFEFTTAVADADGCDLLMTNGTLQYLEHGLADLLRPLRQRPRHLLVNRVPFTDRPTYFTVQNIGPAHCPYRISNLEEFRASIREIGYEQVDSWACPESYTAVRFRRWYTVPSYTGYYFRLRV